LAKGSQQVLPAVVFPIDEHTSFRAVVADLGGKMRLLQAGSKDGLSNDWVVAGEVNLPSLDSDMSQAIEIASISANSDTIVVTTSDGAVHYWPVADTFGGMSSAEATGQHQPPTASRHSRTWRAACRLSEGKVVRLASTWRKLANDVFDWHPELFI
jgi:hypothetical protein